MREGMSGQTKASHTQGLALCLVDGHAEGWPQWELPRLNLNGGAVSVGLVLMRGMEMTLPILMLQPVTMSAS